MIFPNIFNTKSIVGRHIVRQGQRVVVVKITESHNALSPFKLKTINALTASFLNFQLHQRVDYVASRCYNAFCSAVQVTSENDLFVAE